MNTHFSKSLGLGSAIVNLLTAASLQASNTFTMDFYSPNGAVLDSAGNATGFTTRLTGTGSLLPANDYNMNLSTETGILEFSPQQSDYNGQVNMGLNSAPGVNLSTLGFTGTEDFVVHALFAPPAYLPQFVDQVGVYVGKDSATLTRAGFITFSAPTFPSIYSVNTVTGADQNGNFIEGGYWPSGLSVTIGRVGGIWVFDVNGVPCPPVDETGLPLSPTFLDGETDLTVGIFAITPFNSNFNSFPLQYFSATVVPEPSGLALFGVGGFVWAGVGRRRRPSENFGHTRFLKANPI